MRHLLCLLLLALFPALAFGQVTFSRSAVTFTQRATGPVAFAQTVTVTGTGTLSLGTCTATNPGFFTNPCPSGQDAWTVAFSSLSSPSTLTLYFAHTFGDSLPVGDTTWTQVINSTTGCTGGCTLTLTAHVVAINIASYTSPNGTPVGCTNSGDPYPPADLDICTPWIDYSAPFTPWVGQGSTYVDSRFGAIVKQISPSPPAWNAMYEDAAAPALNSDGTLCITAQPNGENDIYSTSTGLQVYPTFNADIAGFYTGSLIWSATVPTDVYYTRGMSWYRYSVLSPGGPGTIVATLGGTSNTIIGPGADTPPSKDNFICFFGDVDNHSYVANLATGTIYTTPAWPTSPVTTCTTGCAYTIRNCRMTVGVNVPDGNRYFAQAWDGAGGEFLEKYHITGGGAVVDDGPLGGSKPDAGENGWTADAGCTTTAQWDSGNCFDNHVVGHSTVAEVNGVQYWVYGYGQGIPFAVSEFWSRWDSHAMGAITEDGGGLTVSPTIAGGDTDTHQDCALSTGTAGVCVFSTDASNFPAGIIPSWGVTAVSASGSSPIVLTTGTAYPGANGDSIIVAGMFCDPTGAHSSNGIQTVGGLSGTSLNLVGTTANCTWNPNIPGTPDPNGSFIKNANPSQIYAHQDEIIVMTATPGCGSLCFAVNRIAKSRDMLVSDKRLDTYYGGSHAVISADGTRVAWESNNGYPDTQVAFTALSGFTPPAASGSVIGGSVRFKGVVIH